ncbi:hypothetical protein DITRI_Ditri06bG0015200 [Diplodiscus trichospermus]
MMATLKIIWKLSREVDIAALEDNLFLFKFQCERDKDRVLEGAPWSFDKHMLLFHEFKGELRPEEYCLRQQRFGLDAGGWANFLRLRMEIDITKPLRRAVKLGGGHGGKEIWGSLGAYQYGDWLRASPLRKDITYNKQQSSSAKTSAFLSQVKGRIEGRTKQSDLLPARESGPVRCLKLGDEVSSNVEPKSHATEGKKAAAHGVDLGESHEADSIALHQKIMKLDVRDGKATEIHTKGNYDKSKDLQPEIWQEQLAARQEEHRKAEVPTKEDYVTIIKSLHSDRSEAQFSITELTQIDTSATPHARANPKIKKQGKQPNMRKWQQLARETKEEQQDTPTDYGKRKSENDNFEDMELEKHFSMESLPYHRFVTGKSIG